MDEQIQKSIFRKAYFTFFVYGFMTLMLGVVINSVIAEYGIDYGIAGLFVALFSAGSIAAGFLCSYLIRKIGYRTTILSLTAFIPLAYLGITLTPQKIPLLLFFFASGIGCGTIGNINNAIVNECAVGESTALNILHMFFAVGAFMSPIIASVLTQLGIGWRYTVFIGIAICLVMLYTYSTVNFEFMESAAKKRDVIGPASTKRPYYKFLDFYLAAAILFFYVGAEISINGWLITYLKNRGIVGTATAQRLLSILWMIVIFGRLMCASLSKRFAKKTIIFANIVASVFFLILLITAQTESAVTISVTGIGFFFAGIYPTTVANVGSILKGSSKATAVLLASGSFGGIVTPVLLGVVAEKINLRAGMGVIIASVMLMLCAAAILQFKKEGISP